MHKPYTLEVCADSVESALAAEAGGATRLELCSGLVIGGLSPSLALFREVRRRCRLPVRVLLRPRYGDFLYSEPEFAVLLEEVSLFREAGADGVVVGCLTADGALDMPRMQALVQRADGLPVTLHRAFDMAADPLRALEDARALGVSTILTSGQQNACSSGRALLQELLGRAGDAPEILIGGGVNAAVIRDFTAAMGARHFHMSGKAVLQSGMRWRNPAVSMGAASLDEYAVWRTDAEAVRAAADVLQTAYRA
ncbi:copper homeostasis protein CutC [Intestinibacillus massiliensis]|uniref:copper homeostasis protein CutC n=1 Tax=Intestinibacillus massiliensis TaxID=1871029 RepID=UPI000B34D325|nr:copper homeostasis protein CutC [Intestinibacillus massiliensis]